MTAAPAPGARVLTERDVESVLAWFAQHGRDLPWRRADRTPWGVLVCEVMSHQTPVARILGPWRDWMDRWPDPGALAAASPGDALRMWGRLGYPRRALRLHAAAVAITADHGGRVPGTVAELLALPGIGAYTAAATAAFGFGVRTVVLDVNVRRVLTRVAGSGELKPGAPTNAEIARAAALLPQDPPRSAVWNAAVMELGALVCTARTARCPDCPLQRVCPGPGPGSGPGADPRAAAGRARTTRAQPWHGTDRQVRGLVMAHLREAEGPVPLPVVDLVWPDPVQLARCVEGLVSDGLAERAPGALALPGGVPEPPGRA